MKWLLWLVCLLAASPLAAEGQRLRLATYNLGLGRDGPGLLLKYIIAQEADILALAEIIGTISPDILLITGFDNDYTRLALSRFNGLEGLGYPYLYAPLGNAGAPSGLDINGNGRSDDRADAWGFGRFEGAKGMALLSRFPISNARSFDLLKWQDFGPPPLDANGQIFFAHWPELRLASHSLWDVEITTPGGALHILAAHATPPVFDGPEDANGLRNAAEIGFLLRYLSGEAFADDRGTTAPLADAPVVLLADLNADPERGESLKAPLRQLLAHPRLQPLPWQATVTWPGLGPMQVDYVLPDARLKVLGHGVFWDDAPARLRSAAQTRHRLIWADIAFP